MITPEDKLEIFEDFRVDRELPKYRAKRDRKTAMAETRASQIIMADSEDLDLTENSRFTVNTWASNSGVRLVPIKKDLSWWESSTRALAFWRKAAPEPTLSIADFFKSVKNTARELQIVEERARGYEQAMVNAKKAGQVALFEHLTAGLNATRMEVQLLAIGLPKYILEEDLVTFYKKSKRGLRLDWVRNFTRTIPLGILEKKERSDILGIFDNYVVLHYDPEAKSYAETQQEKEAKKDPILFGVMSGRRILYFVGDWIDEFCDLTLDQIADTVGKDAIKHMDALPHPYREPERL